MLRTTGKIITDKSEEIVCCFWGTQRRLVCLKKTEEIGYWWDVGEMSKHSKMRGFVNKGRVSIFCFKCKINTLRSFKQRMTEFEMLNYSFICLYNQLLYCYITNYVQAIDQRDSIGSWISFGYKREILKDNKRFLFCIKRKIIQMNNTQLWMSK